MKNKRSGIEIADFSGGQITKAPLTGVDTKYSPDCLNVYAEGKALRQRGGITVLNPTASSGNGNGIYNWVKSATNQLLMAVFGTVTYSIGNSNGWTGTLAAIAPDSTNGSPFADAIRHFVTYNGTLIMTSESRDKPQFMTVNDTSHFNLDFGGAGTAPLGKYPQVWKEHVWVLNIGQGGALTEEATDISGWVDNDTGTGASTQTDFSGVSTFRFLGGTNAADNAKRTRDIGTLPDDYTIELRAYYDTLTTIATGNYASVNMLNGVINFQTRYSDDGLEINDGSTWNEVGVDLVSEDAFITWKFIVTGGTATGARVDVLKDGVYVGLQWPVFAANLNSDGQINLSSIVATATSRPDWYMDYLYINSSNPVTDRIANGGFEAWGGGLPNSWNVYPTQALVQYRLNDSAANTNIADSGVVNTTANVYAGASTINSSAVSVAGKIVNAVSFASTSSHNIRFPAAAVTSIGDDNVGTLLMWVNPTVSSSGCVFSFTNNTTATHLTMRFVPNKLKVTVQIAGVDKWVFDSSIDIASSAWTHLSITHDATGPKLYINSSLDSIAYSITTDKTAWFNDFNVAANSGRIGDFASSGGEADFYTGLVDDFRYYSTVLTSTEINSIYAEGSGNEGINIVTQEATTVKFGASSLKVSSTGQYSITNQLLSTGAAIAGISCVAGAWINITNAATYKLRATAGTTITDSAILVGNGTWQYQTLSFTPVSASTAVNLQMITTSSSTFYMDHFAVVASSSGIISDNSDRLQRSAVGFYNDWSGTDSGYNDITTPGDIGLTGSAILNDKMYVFKRWSIHRVTYTGSTPLLDIKRAKQTVGTGSPRSVQNIDIPGKGEVVVFLGTDRRIYLFDGYETTPISDNISVTNNLSSVYLNNINTQALDKVYAIVHSGLSWYEIFLPLGGGSVPNYSVVIDFSSGQPVFWPNSNRNFRSGEISDNGIGERVAYVQGATDGKIYLTNSGNGDNGSAINSYWTSFKVGSPVLLSRMDEIEVQTDSVACTPVFGWRMDFESSYTTKTLSASSYSHNYNPGRIDNLIQFKITNNSTNPSFKLWLIGAYERVLGGGK